MSSRHMGIYQCGINQMLSVGVWQAIVDSLPVPIEGKARGVWIVGNKIGWSRYDTSDAYTSEMMQT